MQLHSTVSSGRYTALQKGIPPGVRFLGGFAKSGQLANAQRNWEHIRKLEKNMQTLKALSSLITQKTLNMPEPPENAGHGKEMMGTIKTQQNYENQYNIQKQRKATIKTSQSSTKHKVMNIQPKLQKQRNR